MELGYFDDTEYTFRRAQLLALKGYGNFYIQAYLERLCIPSELIDQACERLINELNEEHRILMILKKKKGIEREKIIRYLAGRGFPYEVIINVINGADE